MGRTHTLAYGQELVGRQGQSRSKSTAVIDRQMMHDLKAL